MFHSTRHKKKQQHEALFFCLLLISLVHWVPFHQKQYLSWWKVKQKAHSLNFLAFAIFCDYSTIPSLSEHKQFEMFFNFKRKCWRASGNSFSNGIVIQWTTTKRIRGEREKCWQNKLEFYLLFFFIIESSRVIEGNMLFTYSMILQL